MSGRAKTWAEATRRRGELQQVPEERQDPATGIRRHQSVAGVHSRWESWCPLWLGEGQRGH